MTFDSSSQKSDVLAAGLWLLACLVLIVVPVSAQERSEYPEPFVGGYLSMNGRTGSGKMYMESYFPPPVTASPTYPAWSPDGDSLAFAYQGRLVVVSGGGGIARPMSPGVRSGLRRSIASGPRAVAGPCVRS